MKIVQILPVLAYGDAIGNDTLTLDRALKESGYKAEIYAEVIDDRLSKNIARQIDELQVEEDDVLIYHLSTCSALNYKVENYNCSRIIMYHNVTPPEFFRNINPQVEKNCEEGLRGARHLADKVDYALADSAFNKSDLIKMGYSCDIDVLPILIAFKDFEKAPNKKVLNRYKDDKKNIVFTGRIAPNKKQEDVINAFYFYHRYLNKESRLILVGSYNGMEQYYGMLKSYTKRLGIEDAVIFTGHIKFDEILAYYNLADLFLCMSEHEGFCVPLIEAMYFDVPIVAYNSTAIGETLGGSGFLLDDKNPIEVAMVVDKIIKSETLRNAIVSNQRERISYFDNQKITNQFLEYIKCFIRNRKEDIQ